MTNPAFESGEPALRPHRDDRDDAALAIPDLHPQDPVQLFVDLTRPRLKRSLSYCSALQLCQYGAITTTRRLFCFNVFFAFDKNGLAFILVQRCHLGLTGPHYH